MLLQFKIIGALLMLLALVHVIFPRYFNWKKELGTLSLINRQVMQVHTFFIAFTVFLMGLLCFTSGEELLSTPLGINITFGLGVFWLLRLLIQLFWYSPKLWRGKTFETIVHFGFTALWIYFATFFLAVTFA